MSSSCAKALWSVRKSALLLTSGCGISSGADGSPSEAPCSPDSVGENQSASISATMPVTSSNVDRPITQPILESC